MKPQLWDDLIGGLPGAHLLQTAEWGDFKAQYGWRAHPCMGAGEHRLSLPDAREVPAGIYLVRLSRDGRGLTTKGCVVR